MICHRHLADRLSFVLFLVDCKIKSTGTLIHPKASFGPALELNRSPRPRVFYQQLSTSTSPTTEKIISRKCEHPSQIYDLNPRKLVSPQGTKLVELRKNLSTMLLPPFQVIRYFDFSQIQTVLSLIKFVEKSSNIFNPRQIYYENIFNYWFNKTNLIL